MREAKLQKGKDWAWIKVCCSVARLCLTLQSHGLQHAKLPCPSPSPSAQTHIHWVGDAIQTSHPLLSPSSPALNLSQHQDLFKWVSSLHQVARVLELQLQHKPSNECSGLISFRMDWLDLLAVQGLSTVFSNTTVQKHRFFNAHLSLWSNSHIHMITGKIIALMRQTFVGKVMSLHFNILSRLVVTFLPRSKRLLICMATVTICSDFGAQENKVCHCFISICHEVMGPDAMIFVFWMLSFKLAFLLSSFTFIKRLFHSSSLFAIRVVSSAYLRLLIFLPAILTSLWFIQPGISHDVLCIYGKGNGNSLQHFCLQNFMDKPRGLQSMGSQRIRHD